MIKERALPPIKDLEVRAILEGRKTQMRRIIKPQPEGPLICRILDGTWGYEWNGDDWRCPYGKPGDRRWVREAHAIGADSNTPPWYRLDHPEARSSGPRVDVKWRPSIHMPRWASRITLEITRVRVERLQSISEGDAIAEGCPLINPDPFIPGHGGSSASGWYSQLWESIHGAGSWDLNPWVWAIDFRKVPQTSSNVV